MFKNQPKKILTTFFVLGLLIPSAIFLVPAYIAALRFPGYCDKGDGSWCTGTGLDGYAEYLFGGNLGPGVYWGVGFLLVLLLIWSAFITVLFLRSPDTLKTMIFGYSFVFVFLLWQSLSPWHPLLTEGAIRGFLP